MAEPQRPEDSGLYLDLLVSTGKPSLAELGVVDKLVRGFTARVLEIRAGFHSGEPWAKDAMGLIEAEARKGGDVIMGRDLRFDAQPWNNVRRLGAVIRSLLRDATTQYGDPGTALFMHMANQTVEAAVAIENGADEERMREELAKICHDVTARIVGVR